MSVGVRECASACVRARRKPVRTPHVQKVGYAGTCIRAGSICAWGGGFRPSTFFCPFLCAIQDVTMQEQIKRSATNLKTTNDCTVQLHTAHEKSEKGRNRK